MSTYTLRELAEIVEIKSKWEAYEYSKWRLISFSQNEARFGWNVNGMYQKYVTITRAQIDFIIGVDSDVINAFYC